MAAISAASIVDLADAALSVLSQQSDGIVVQLRSTILLDDKDLFGPIPVTTCSSMDDGPFCEKLGGLPNWLDADTRARSAASSEMILAAGDYSAHSVVDGVLSQRLRTRNEEAFDWSTETQRTFSGLVSRVVGDSLGGSKRLIGTSSARSGAQSFRFQFDRLRPWWRRVPESFSDGLPASLGVSWSGAWAIASDFSGEFVGSDLPVWRTFLSLETSVGYLRFKTQVVVRKLILSVPFPEKAAGCLVCGRLKGTERWCSALDSSTAGSLYIDVGNSFYGVDEVAFVAVPPKGVIVHLVEVAATVPSRLHGEAAERKVVLLKRPDLKQGLASKLIEPSFTTVSRDAPFWNLNEVVQQNMLLRSPPHVASVAASTPSSKKKKGSSSTSTFSGVSGFLEMLQALKSGSIKSPAGVPLSQLKKEMAVLVASTKEIQDDDVLMHSKIDSLLQQRVRERSLDGLLALQAEWGRRDMQGSPLQNPDQAEVDTSGDESGTPSATITTTIAAASVPSDLWGEDVAEAMHQASADLEKKSIEAREKRKKDSTIEFQMESGEGTIEVRVVGGEKLSRSMGGTELEDEEDSEEEESTAILENKLENLLGPLRSTLDKHVEKILETATRTRSEDNSDDDDGDEDRTATNKDVKIEVQVLNMDEDGGFDSEELAQMMQSMFQGDGSGIDMQEMMQSMFQSDDDDSDSGVLTGAMEAIMQALQQAQSESNDDEDDSDELDMDVL